MANSKKMDCVILGLLSHKPMTGYEIKKQMDYSLRFFWGASYGSIYPTLNNLVKDGMIVSKDISENGRDKIQYTITEKGSKHLKKWLILPVEKDELRYETLLKLFFGCENGVQETLHHIEVFENKTKKELAFLKMMEAELEQIKDTEDAHIYYLLTVRFGVKTYEAYLSWCEEAKKCLEESKV